MSIYEISSNVIAFVALFISGLSYWKANKSSSAGIEIALNTRITETKEKVSDVTILMTPILSKKTQSADEKRMIKSYEKQFNLAIENNLNAYEEACAKYIDRKVDRVRFKKIYKSEIKKLVENDDFKQYFDSLSCEFQAIVKVYKEWETLEK